MKSLLVIGAAGFIGRHLIKELDGYDVTYFIRKGRKVEGKGRVFYGDIVKKEEIIKASVGKDLIINLAAPNTQLYHINRGVIVEGTKNIIEAAKKNKVKKIISLSSYAAYRKNLDNYGKAKKEADEILKKSGLNVVILRLPMVYGEGGYAFSKLMSSVRKVPFFVFVIGDGRYKVQPAYVRDVVEAIKSSIKLKNTGISIFDVGGTYLIEYDMFLKKILAILNKKKMLIHIPLRFVLIVTGFLNMFVRNVAWNTTSIKRLVEPTYLDVKKTENILKIKLTGYDKALRKVLC